MPGGDHAASPSRPRGRVCPRTSRCRQAALKGAQVERAATRSFLKRKDGSRGGRSAFGGSSANCRPERERLQAAWSGHRPLKSEYPLLAGSRPCQSVDRSAAIPAKLVPSETRRCESASLGGRWSCVRVLERPLSAERAFGGPYRPQALNLTLDERMAQRPIQPVQRKSAVTPRPIEPITATACWASYRALICATRRP